MIKNERQYKITKSQEAKFALALSELKRTRDNHDLHPVLREAEIAAVKSQLNELREIIREYEHLKSSSDIEFSVSSFSEIPMALVKARIASGLTQKDLAERLSLKEQQIQRYEANDYLNTSMSRLVKIADALGVTLKGDAVLEDNITNLPSLFSTLNSVGISKEFLTNRILPAHIVEQALSEDMNREQEKTILYQIAEWVSRVFKIATPALLRNERIDLSSGLIYLPVFKKPKNTDEKRTNAYAIYVHYLAMLVLDATKDDTKPIPTDSDEIVAGIRSIHGDMSFIGALKYVWSLGIPVLPLDDFGTFHGACWRVEGRSIIVLKQSLKSQARWLFDLLHELCHLAKDPSTKQMGLIEYSDMSRDRIESQEEQRASYYAAEIMLEGRAKELSDECVDYAKGSVEALKKAAIVVARKNNVPVEYLANYLAHRLSLQRINWWGAASNLQRKDINPFLISRNLLSRKLELSVLSDEDRSLLSNAIRAQEEV